MKDIRSIKVFAPEACKPALGNPSAKYIEQCLKDTWEYVGFMFGNGMWKMIDGL